MRKNKNGSWETQKVGGRLQATQDMQNWCQVIVVTAVCLIKCCVGVLWGWNLRVVEHFFKEVLHKGTLATCLIDL